MHIVFVSTNVVSGRRDYVRVAQAIVKSYPTSDYHLLVQSTAAGTPGQQLFSGFGPHISGGQIYRLSSRELPFLERITDAATAARLIQEYGETYENPHSSGSTDAILVVPAPEEVIRGLLGQLRQRPWSGSVPPLCHYDTTTGRIAGMSY